MTNEEAITILTLYRAKIVNSVSIGIEEDVKAYDMAISALSQMESAGTQITNSNLKSESEIKVDLISREEAVECCFNGWNKGYKEIAEDIKKLPTYPANLVKESGVLVKDLVKEDLISRQAVLDFTTEWCNRCGKRKEYDGVLCKCCDLADTIDFVEELPTIPQTDLELVDKKRLLNKMWRDFWAMEDKKTEEQGADYVGLPRLYEQNGFDCALRTVVDFPTIPQTDYESHEAFGWCNGCKEYDNEKHCCHRYSSFILESLNENINAVLEDIKAELQTLADDEWNQKVMADKGLELAIEIIENYISRKE